MMAADNILEIVHCESDAPHCKWGNRKFVNNGCKIFCSCEAGSLALPRLTYTNQSNNVKIWSEYDDGQNEQGDNDGNDIDPADN